MTEGSAPQETSSAASFRQKFANKIRRKIPQPLDRPELELERPKVNGYFSPEMAQVEDQVIAACERFAGGFKEGRFGLMVADDTSARLSGLVIKEVSDGISEREDLPKVPIYFVDAGAYSNKGRVEAQLEKLPSRFKDIERRRALLITEFMNTGYSMEMLNEALKELGIACDIAALETVDHKYGNIALSPDSGLFIAKYSDTGNSPLHNQPKWTGLSREKDTHRIVVRKVSDSKKHAINRELASRARQDVHLMAHRAIQRIYPKPQADIINQ